MGDGTTMAYLLTVCAKNENTFSTLHPNLNVIGFRYVDDLNIITNLPAGDPRFKNPHDVFKLLISFYSDGLVAEEEPADGFKIKTLGTLMFNENGKLDIQVFHKNAIHIEKTRQQKYLNFMDYRSWGPSLKS